ncbi:hypothetical protein [Streptomyces umbrinus]|uniref:hypothetical protein n=1 Tax=Streptomyces umbrinus TaxID=67370 RepID=UPI00343C9CA1
MAGLFAAKLVGSGDVQWSDVTDLYCLDGWQACSLAVADVLIAEQFGLAVTLLSI